MEKRLFTSESVTEGHPDKICDNISDGILDALMEQDPMSRVACETAITTDYVLIMGEITTKAKVDYEKIARETIREIGYDDTFTVEATAFGPDGKVDLAMLNDCVQTIRQKLGSGLRV